MMMDCQTSLEPVIRVQDLADSGLTNIPKRNDSQTPTSATTTTAEATTTTQEATTTTAEGKEEFANSPATNEGSNPWHPMFVLVITVTMVILQMHFPDSSPLDQHPITTWIGITCLLFYGFAFGYHEKCQSHTPMDHTSLNRCVKVAIASGSLAYSAFISLLLPRSRQPLVFIVCVLSLFIYFNHKKVEKMGENMTSSLSDLWGITTSRASNLYERFWGTERDNVTANNRAPI